MDEQIIYVRETGKLPFTYEVDWKMKSAFTTKIIPENAKIIEVKNFLDWLVTYLGYNYADDVYGTNAKIVPVGSGYRW